MRRAILCAVVVTLTCLASNAASLQGLGDLPGGTASSFAHEVSGDGTTVVGMSDDGTGPMAYRWTAATGMVALGGPAPTPRPINATGVSFDGSVIVGGLGDGAGYRWTAATGLVPIPGVFGMPWSPARGISADGTVVVGDTAHSSGVGPGDAYRWTATGGTQQLPDVAFGDGTTFANDASADGSVIVGKSGGGGGSGEAFRWTAAGTVGLGDLGSAFETHFTYNSQANATSSDGSVVAGYGTPITSSRQAFRWTAGTGMVGLAPGAGWTFSQSQAWDVSADGSVIVGDAGGSNAAFVWTSATGIRPLANLLQEAGVDLTGWQIASARSVSADGTVVAGFGFHNGNQEAFVAVIPEPASLASVAMAAAALGGCRRRRAR